MFCMLLLLLPFPGVMFFLGLLMSVEALSSAGLLQTLAGDLVQAVPRPDALAGAIGLASALIDNVPLVAATMTLSAPPDSELWQLIALCAGAQRTAHSHMLQHAAQH